MTPLEASELEIERALRKLETRMMVAVEGSRRDAVRNGCDQLRTIAQDQQVLATFKEAIEKSSRAGVGWLAIASAFTRVKGAGFEGEAANIDLRIQQHCAVARAKADDWLLSIVVRLGAGVRKREAS
jgi:hypothetical protein